MIRSCLFMLLLGLTAWVGCTKDETDGGTPATCSGTTPTYTKDVQSILATNCALSGCHSATSKASGIDLSTYAAAKAEAVKPRFLGAIKHEGGFSPMPQGRSKLAAATIQKLECWVSGSTPD